MVGNGKEWKEKGVGNWDTSVMGGGGVNEKRISMRGRKKSAKRET